MSKAQELKTLAYSWVNAAEQMHQYAEAYANAKVAAERERLRVLVEAVRDANKDAQADDKWRPLTPGQERAWIALLAATEGST